MKISLIEYTQNAKELLIFTKNTRHLSSDARFEDVKDLTDRQKDEQLSYVFGTIGSAWEFVNYTFLIQDVTRSFTHQMVRHRTGTAFAQQSLRVASVDDFRYFIPDKIEKDAYLSTYFENAMGDSSEWYEQLLKKGADQQDARGVLPINICTNILVKMNLRALSHLMETRLCIRAQGEFQEVALTMKGLVAGVHPWADDVLNPCCVLHGYCPWRNFTECPIKKKYNHLWPPDNKLNCEVKNDWEVLMFNKYSPQPEQSK